MNAAIVINTWRGMIAGRLRVWTLGIVMFLPVFESLLTRGNPAKPGFTLLIVWLLGTGIIGAEARSGVLRLVLARPVTRAEYVFSKWIALSSGAFLGFLVQTLVAAVILTAKGMDYDSGETLLRLADGLSVALGAAAFFVFLSAVFPGNGDFGAILLLWLLWYFLTAYSARLGIPSAVWSELMGALYPSVNFHSLVHHLSMETARALILPYLSNLSLSLALAVAALNRKELTCAMD